MTLEENPKFALIAGGTGNVGEGLVLSLIEKGWNVVVPGRTKSGLDRLTAFCSHSPRLHVHQFDISNPDSSKQFFSNCRTLYPPFQLLVASIGGWRQGTDLLSLSWEEWQLVMRDNLSSHFLVMKFGFPLLQADGAYVHINGMGAELVIPTAGPVVAAAAAQLKLALTLAEEQKNKGRKVYELLLGLVNTRARNSIDRKGDDLISPALIASYILLLLDPAFPQSKKVFHLLKDTNAVISHLN